MKNLYLSLFALLATATLATSAQAAQVKTVTVDLSGKVFTDKLDFDANSVALLLASPRYDYKVEATITGSGSLSNAIPAHTPLATFLDQLKAGSSSFLTGVAVNPSGKLPFNKVMDKTFSGKVHVGNFTVPASLTLTARIDETGMVIFHVTKISIQTPFGINVPPGSVTFDAGSKVTIGNELLGTEGTYAGLIMGGTPNTSGIASVTLDKFGKTTGTVVLGGKSHSFKGALDSTGASNAITLIKPDTILTLALSVQNKTIAGTGTAPNAFTFSASRGTFTKDSPLAQIGTYNTILLADALPQGKTAADIPQGTGFGVLKIKADGSVAATLVLGDKTKVTAKGLITSGSDLAIYASTDKGSGDLIGLLSLNVAGNTPLLSGNLNWIKPPVSNKPFAAGFNTTVTTKGELYTKPVAPKPLLPSPLNLNVSYGNLGVNAIQQQIDIDPATNKALADGANPQGVKVTLKTSNGLFSGSFNAPGTGKATKFSGITLPKDFVGAAGFFVGTPAAGTPVETGSVKLQ